MKSNSSDLSYYFIIQHTPNLQLQLLYYKKSLIFQENTLIPIIFTASTSNMLCILLQSHHKIFVTLSREHALYLGKELIKAELSLIMGQKYVQD